MDPAANVPAATPDAPPPAPSSGSNGQANPMLQPSAMPWHGSAPGPQGPPLGWGHGGGFQYNMPPGFLPQNSSSFAPQIPGFGLFPSGVGPHGQFNPSSLLGPSHQYQVFL